MGMPSGFWSFAFGLALLVANVWFAAFSATAHRHGLFMVGLVGVWAAVYGLLESWMRRGEGAA